MSIKTMRWIYLSPHFDDVALSCGGLVWEQVRAGQSVEIWTICAGAPGADAAFSEFALALHRRWETGPETVPARKAEDKQAGHRLGAGLRYWDLPDCIYRRLPNGDWLVNGEEDLWQSVHPAEQGVVNRLAEWISQETGETFSTMDTRLVSPLTLGNHVDHSLVRAAAEQATAAMHLRLWYYMDYPYVAKPETNWNGKVGEGWQQTCQPVSRQALVAWQDAVASYGSQISTFWPSRMALNAGLEDYWLSGGGTCLWHPG